MTTPDGGASDPLRLEVARLMGGPLDTRRWKQLGEALTVLHHRFVSEDAPEAAPIYLDARTSLAAYLAYFHEASAAQVQRALADVEEAAVVRLPATLRVLDVGAGTGGATEGVRAWAAAAGRSVKVIALEPSGPARETQRRVFRGDATALEPRAWKAGDALPEGPFDVVVASHVVNELFPDHPTRLDERTKFAQSLAARLTPEGLLVLMEPALKRTGRELLVVRDRLLAQSKLAALAPCLFQGACPAIQRPRDWCHAHRPWSPTSLVQEAGRAANLERDDLKYTAVILTPRHPSPERTRDPALFRIVSSRLEEKGKSRYFGCGPTGRHALVRLDRTKSEANAAFDGLQRGDLVRLGRLVPSGDGQRVEAETTIVVEQSAAALDVR